MAPRPPRGDARGLGRVGWTDPHHPWREDCDVGRPACGCPGMDGSDRKEAGSGPRTTVAAEPRCCAFNRSWSRPCTLKRIAHKISLTSDSLARDAWPSTCSHKSMTCRPSEATYAS